MIAAAPRRQAARQLAAANAPTAVVGPGLHNYHDTYNAFPRYMQLAVSGKVISTLYRSPQDLPFIEQQAL